MRPQDIIRKKRDGEELSREEISAFIKGVVDKSITDYQASALLMAIFFRGMTDDERHALTDEMVHSGDTLDLSYIQKIKVDKHSTGGVGDKTSLIVAPLAAASGLCVPMISGRGLGHTGGTLDKLESIPGFHVNLSLDQFRMVLDQIGFSLIGQTSQIAPADKKLYALRDATATVESLPLIVASILSKKLAAGLDALVLDVKTGNGAFMKDETESKELARVLVHTANSFGVKTKALITDMNQPLGCAIGNALEVHECIRILKGENDHRVDPVRKLSIELVAHMLMLSDKTLPIDVSRKITIRNLESGLALEKFRQCVEAQGGDPHVCDQPLDILPQAKHMVEIKAGESGYINTIDTSLIGHSIARIGGGRVKAEDGIDPAVGFLSYVKIGDKVNEREILGILHCQNKAQAEQISALIQNAFHIKDDMHDPIPTLIKEIIEPNQSL